nr:hypothetical protein [Bacteroidota bacterium]
MKVIKTLAHFLLFCLLTLITQVGGIAYLVSFLTHEFINSKTSKLGIQRALKVVVFLLIYSISSFVIVPPLAKIFGRVPLPFTETNNLQPLNIITCLLNRNYVRSALKEAAFEAANKMNTVYPGTIVNYLDANFPFYDGFPLFPHLSHSDGKKLDLSFCYTDTKTQESTNLCPSIIGYGICEEPLPGEINTPNYCGQKGYWQYSFLKKIIPQSNHKNFALDKTKTKDLVNAFATNSVIGKIFIEPHLKTRLKLTNEKIRFHGCQAVRHDDHIHVQLK